MHRFMRAIWRITSDEEGAGAVEYTGITIVVVTIVVALVAMSTRIGTTIGSGLEAAACAVFDRCDAPTPTEHTVAAPGDVQAPVAPVVPDVEAVTVAERQPVDPFGNPVVQLPDGSYVPIADHQLIDPTTGQPYEIVTNPETGQPEIVNPDGSTQPLPPGAADLVEGQLPDGNEVAGPDDPQGSDVGDPDLVAPPDGVDGSEPGAGPEAGEGDDPDAGSPGDGSDVDGGDVDGPDVGDGTDVDGPNVDSGEAGDGTDVDGPDVDGGEAGDGQDVDGQDVDGQDASGTDPDSSDVDGGSGPTTQDLDDLTSGDLPEVASNGAGETGSGGGETTPGGVDPDMPGTNDQAVADPVNSRTGAFVTAGVDLVRQLPGTPLVLTRSYSSTDSRVGPLGRGWTHGYDLGIERDRGDRILVRTENGHRVPFDVDEETAEISSPPGVTSTLSRVDGGLLLERRDGSTIRFDSDGRATELADRNGITTTLSYDEPGRLVEVSSAGQAITFSYEGERLVAAELSDGRQVRYHHEDDLLVEVVDVRGSFESYEYDEGGRVARVVDNAGNLVVENTYDDDDRVIEQQDVFGATYELEYASDGAYDVTIYQDPLGNRTAYVYSGERLVRTKDALERTTTFRYDDDLNLVEVEAADGSRVQASYDGRGFPTRLIDATGAATELRWGEHGVLTQLVDAEGAAVSFDHDDAGNLLSVEAPDGATQTYAYDDLPGLVTELTDPLGASTSFEYDDLGQFVGLVTAEGGRLELEYDGAGNVVSFTDPAGFVDGSDPADHTWSMGWDEGGLLTEVVDPLGATTTYTYDAMARPTSVTDGEGNRIVYEYDARGRLAEVVAADGTATRYLYDVVGNLIQRVDPSGAVTQYGYDEVGQLVAVVSPAFQRWTYRYDDVGNLVEVVTPEGADAATAGRIAISYDEAGRPVAIDPADAASVDLEWSPAGRLSSIEDEAGQETRGYDQLGRLVEVARGDQTITYDYDLAGNLLERVVDGELTEYRYDADRRLVAVASQALSAEYELDPAGRMTGAVFGNDARVDAVWDAAGRLVKITHRDGDASLLESLSYRYDDAGNPREIRGMDEVLRHRYDGLSRLVQSTVVSRGTGAELAQWTYQYDDAGRRVAQRDPSGEVSVFRYAAGDQLRQIVHDDGSVTDLEYDANGRRIAVGDDRFTYDVLDRLVTQEVDGITTEFLHDGLGRRVAERVGGEDVRSYLWDPNALNDQLAALVDEGTRQDLTLLPGAGTLGVATESGIGYLHADALGSVVATTGADGGAAWRYGYEPFGAERRSEEIRADSVPAPLRFTGELLDEATGDYHLRLRQYDPSLGQFTSIDPAGASMARPYTSVYNYVDNRPTVWTDPSGACPFCITAAIGGAIGGVVGATTSIVTQAIDGEGINWGEVGTAAVGGAVAGALAGVGMGAPAVAALSGGSFIAAGAGVGAASSLAGNAVTQGLDIGLRGQSWDTTGFVLSGITGAAFGSIHAPFGRMLTTPTPNGLGMGELGSNLTATWTVGKFELMTEMMIHIVRNPQTTSAATSG